MANLNESDSWPTGIYQIEEDDPVLGGPSGITNQPPTQLASRTLYQRLRGVTPWSATLTYPADAYVSFGGTTWRSIANSTNVQPNTDATKWIRWGYTVDELAASTGSWIEGHESKTDPHPVYWNDPRGNAKIAAAIAALVNSSPNALDTLSELAAALGNDANFAATITNALAAKAPLASPALTGNPTAPTQAYADATTKIATTDFVARAGVRFSSFGSIPGGNYALAITDLPKIIAVPANGQAVTLPPVTDANIGALQRLFVYPGTSTYITVQAPAGQQISTGNTLAGAVVVIGGGFTDFIWEGTGSQHWQGGGGGLLYKSPDFAASYAANGQQTLPGGLLIKWGAFNLGSLAGNGSFEGNVAFPAAFSSACYAGFLVPNDKLLRVGTTGVGVGSISGNFLNDYNGAQNITGFYLAIGK